MGKIKTYKANTNVSINVVLANKKNLHISFTPLSNGTSTFTTDNEEVMDAIERHYNFGKLFRLHSVQGESKPKTAPKGKLPKKEKDVSDNTDNTPEAKEETESSSAVPSEVDNEPETEDESDEPTLKKVKVSDFVAAKDYLADTYGISRTALRSMKAITEQAAAHGIEFEGLE